MPPILQFTQQSGGGAGGAPAAHASSHENGGSDEISVAGLSGLLADAQTPTAHTHNGDTLATLAGVTLANTGLVKIGTAGTDVAIKKGATGRLAVRRGDDSADGDVSAGNAVITGGMTFSGAIATPSVTGAYKPIEANTAVAASPNILIGTESRKVLTNEGTTAENYHTLPSAAAGMEFTFYCQDADGIRIVAAGGDTIRHAATVSALAGFIRCATVGNCVTLVAVNATEWVVSSIIGTWTIDA